MLQWSVHEKLGTIGLHTLKPETTPSLSEKSDHQTAKQRDFVALIFLEIVSLDREPFRIGVAHAGAMHVTFNEKMVN